MSIEPPLLARAGFLSTLHRAHLGVSAYDARRSFARWMEEAGVLETHQQAYLGHGPRTITDLYRRAELAVAQLDADGERLAAYVVGFLVGPAIPETAQVQVARGRIELPTRGFSVLLCDTIGPGPPDSTARYTLLQQHFGRRSRRPLSWWSVRLSGGRGDNRGTLPSNPIGAWDGAPDSHGGREALGSGSGEAGSPRLR